MCCRFRGVRGFATETKKSPSRKHIGKIKPVLNPANPDHYLSLSFPPQAHSGLPSLQDPYLVLGIETSCDDTGVAVVRSDGKILSNIVISQVKDSDELQIYFGFDI